MQKKVVSIKILANETSEKAIAKLKIDTLGTPANPKNQQIQSFTDLF